MVARGRSSYGASTNDWNLPSGALGFINNIVVPASGSLYASGAVALDPGMGSITHNLWFGGAGDVSIDSSPILGDPHFVSAGRDFHLGAGAAVDSGSASVQAIVTDDYDLTISRPKGGGYDVGAYEKP